MGQGGRFVPPIGSLGNLWNNASTGVNTNSNAVNTYNSPWLTVVGNVDGATTLTVFYSLDGGTFYKSTNTVTLSAAGNFTLDFTTAAPYIALQSSANVTATATLIAKG